MTSLLDKIIIGFTHGHIAKFDNLDRNDDNSMINLVRKSNVHSRFVNLKF